MNKILDAIERLRNMTWQQIIAITMFLAVMIIGATLLAGCGTLHFDGVVDYEPIVEELQPIEPDMEAIHTDEKPSAEESKTVPKESRNTGVIITPLNQQDSLKRKLQGAVSLAKKTRNSGGNSQE